MSNVPERFDLMKKHTDGLTVLILLGNFTGPKLLHNNSQRT